MKNFISIWVLCALFAAGVFAQDKPADSAALNQQIAALFQQGKFDNAIPLAEKVVDIEKKLGKNSQAHAFALANLALLHKEKVKVLVKSTPPLGDFDRRGPVREMIESANRAKKLFREALEIHDLSGTQQSVSAATAKSELAWVVYSFNEGRSVAESRAQIDEAEKLYTESIAIQDRLSATPTDLALRTILDFADFYMRYVNFEKALPLYERYLSSVQAKYGAKSKGLVPALRALTEIYFITERDNEASATADRVSAITGKPEAVVPSYPILVLRSQKLEDVKVDNFIPFDLSKDPSSVFSYARGSGSMSPMGRAVMKSLAVNIVVGENGEVVEAKAERPSKYQQDIEKAARASRFRPFSYNGTPQRLRGTIVYSYFEG